MGPLDRGVFEWDLNGALFESLSTRPQEVNVLLGDSGDITDFYLSKLTLYWSGPSFLI